MGTPALAVPPLLALHDAGYDLPLVVTQPDARRGRGGAESPSPVKRAAAQLGIPVSTEVDDALDVGADVAVVVAFGQFIKPHVLERLPMINMHFSLLPRWRGAAPVERALLAGDEVTGVCIMELAEELDVGDVYSRVEVPIAADATLAELRSQLVEVGTELLLRTLDGGLPEPVPQQGEVVWAHKIDPSELEIDWTRPAAVIERVVRLGDAWTTLDGKRLKVWAASVVERSDLGPGEVDGVEVGAGEGALALVEVQPEGKQRLAATDWRRGARIAAGTRLGAG